MRMHAQAMQSVGGPVEGARRIQHVTDALLRLMAHGRLERALQGSCHNECVLRICKHHGWDVIGYEASQAIRLDVASLPASQESRAALAQLSQVCRGRAPNLFGRQAARTILSAFARADLEDDAIFVHLSRIARGRAALPTNSDYAGNESGQPSSGSMSAADELYKPAKRGLY